MKALVIALVAVSFAGVAFAQAPVAPAPSSEWIDGSPPAPLESASFDEREAWCRDYVEWFLHEMPESGPAPADVRSSHRFEVEFNDCKTNPALYRQWTAGELERNER